MQPELNAIRDKYKNRKDQEAMMAMNQETQLVYQKYGISPSGSCIQMLIQMPILFALYRVFYNIPAYIGSVRDSFYTISGNETFHGLVGGIMNTDGFVKKVSDLMTKFKKTYKSPRRTYSPRRQIHLPPCRHVRFPCQRNHKDHPFSGRGRLPFHHLLFP